MTRRQLEILIELHDRIATLVHRSPTMRVLVGPRVLALLQQIRQTRTEKAPT